MVGIMFPAGLVTFEEDDGAIRRGLTAWKFARAGRDVNQTVDDDGLHTCIMTGSGDPIVVSSRRSEADAGAHALMIADRRDYLERYGSEEYQEWSRLLVELERLAG